MSNVLRSLYALALTVVPAASPADTEKRLKDAFDVDVNVTIEPTNIDGWECVRIERKRAM